MSRPLAKRAESDRLSPEQLASVHRSRGKLQTAGELGKAVVAMRMLGARLANYKPEHAMVQEAARRAAGHLADAFAEEDELWLDIKEKTFEHQTVPLFDLDAMSGKFHGQIREAGVGRILFRRGAPASELIALLGAIIERKARRTDRLETIKERLRGVGVRHVRVEAPASENVAETMAANASDESQQGKQGRRIGEPPALYFALVQMVKDLMSRSRAGHEIDPRDLVSLSRDLVTTLRESPDVMRPFAMLRGLERYDFVHPVHATILAASLAARFVEADHDLVEMVRAGLLVDLGRRTMVRLPDMDPDRLPIGDKRHPVDSAMIVDRMPTLTKTAVVVAFEHHLGSDGSGYPRQPHEWRSNVFSSLYRIADRFDALTHPHGKFTARTPASAMAQIRRHVPARYDPDAFEAIRSVVEPAPPGGLVALSDDSIAIVLEAGKDLFVRRVASRRGMLEPGSRALTVGSNHPIQATGQVDANTIPICLLEYLDDDPPPPFADPVAD